MSVDLIEIQRKVENSLYELSKHAVDHMIVRDIEVDEIESAIKVSEVVEDYPYDKYGPSCLLLGFTEKNRPLHILCSYPNRSLIKIITVYEPNLTEWENDWKTRLSQ
jgi:hypothetical protein